MHRYTVYIFSTIITFSFGFIAVWNTTFDQSRRDEPSPEIELNSNEWSNNEELEFTRKNYEKLEKSLNTYFERSEIQPYMVVNNISGEQKNIKVGKHKVKWIDKDKDNVKLRINNEIFTINNYETLNSVWGGEFEVSVFNEWDEIKLFKIDRRDVIGIRLYCFMCSGTVSHLSYYLIYDVKTEQKNFFGAYCAGEGLKLYDFDYDHTIDYLGATYAGKRCTCPDHDSKRIYNLYTLNGKGKFLLQKDKYQNPYFIEQNFYEKEFVEFDELFEQYWIENIYLGY